jgi:hypothetical protein
MAGILEQRQAGASQDAECMFADPWANDKEKPARDLVISREARSNQKSGGEGCETEAAHRRHVCVAR